MSSSINYAYTVTRRTLTHDRGLVQAIAARASSPQQCRDLARLDRQRLLDLGVDLAQTVHVVYSTHVSRNVEMIDHHGTSRSLIAMVPIEEGVLA